MRKRASHWGAARQEDAHEFFTALLNALADEVQQAQVSMGVGVAGKPCARSTAGTAGEAGALSCVSQCSKESSASPRFIACLPSWS
jgi:hypothetical protein